MAPRFREGDTVLATGHFASLRLRANHYLTFAGKKPLAQNARLHWQGQSHLLRRRYATTLPALSRVPEAARGQRDRAYAISKKSPAKPRTPKPTRPSQQAAFLQPPESRIYWWMENQSPTPPVLFRPVPMQRVRHDGWTPARQELF